MEEGTRCFSHRLVPSCPLPTALPGTIQTVSIPAPLSPPDTGDRGITQLYQLGFKNANEPKLSLAFLCVQKCFCFSECRSVGCSAEHHLGAGSSIKPSEGSDPAPAAWWGLFLEFHTSVAGGSGAEPVDVQGECAGHKWCPDRSTPAGASSPCLGAVLWGVWVFVTKLIPKMTVKNRKRLPPCLFAFVGSDLLLICNTKASLVFWLAVSSCRSAQCLGVPVSCSAMSSTSEKPPGEGRRFYGKLS